MIATSAGPASRAATSASSRAAKAASGRSWTISMRARLLPALARTWARACPPRRISR